MSRKLDEPEWGQLGPTLAHAVSSAIRKSPVTSGGLILAVNVREFIRGDNPVRAERIHVGVGSSRRQVVNLFRPVDTQGRVNGGDHVLDARLDLVFPSCLDAGPAIAVGGAEHQSTLDAGPGEHGGKHELVMVAAAHMV